MGLQGLRLWAKETWALARDANCRLLPSLRSRANARDRVNPLEAVVTLTSTRAAASVALVPSRRSRASARNHSKYSGGRGCCDENSHHYKRRDFPERERFSQRGRSCGLAVERSVLEQQRDNLERVQGFSELRGLAPPLVVHWDPRRCKHFFLLISRL